MQSDQCSGRKIICITVLFLFNRIWAELL